MSAWGYLIGIASFLVFICQTANTADALRQQVQPLASLPLSIEPNGLADVPVRIAGRAENLRLDSGGFSMLTESIASVLALRRDHVPYREWIWFAGVRAEEYAVAGSIGFDHFDGPGGKFLVVADKGLPFGIAGQLGAEMLGKYDVEMDVPEEKLNLYSPGQCTNVWPASAIVELPIHIGERGQITVDVRLDGKAAKALLETGLPLSLLGMSAATDLFGFTVKTSGLKTLANRNLSYPFKTLAFQNVEIPNPDIEIQNAQRQWPNIILGMNILRQLHFCVAYDSEKLYVALPTAH